MLGNPFLSSMGGRFLLKAAIDTIANYKPGDAKGLASLGCYLLGVTIACHGFPDASGRTGRVLYAICQCMLSEDSRD